MEEKAEVREKMSRLLNSIRIGGLLRNFIGGGKFEKIGAYSTQKWEVNLWNLWKAGLRDGWRIFFPKIEGKFLSYINVSNSGKKEIIVKEEWI